ncbi:hypothetical protein B0T20DRAFT_463656 [Sordaria brevicollis]|uniref:F-box domain-containing protein n=1 Tax=Sordaria brevicollis TaxID=83679 RepID=A0AAE0P375_SORBR|nr:hypothetical protein B0T20DRAFT_463656 [Sordaria brevicollis]
MRPFIPTVLPPDLAALTSTPDSISTGGYRHLLDDDLTQRSPPYLDTIISPSTGTLSPPTTASPDLGILNILPTELIIPILNHCDIRTLLYFRLLNRHALSLVDLCPGYLPIRQHAPNVLRGILAIETGKYWTLPQLWNKLCQNTCDSPPTTCNSRGGSFAGYLCLLKGKRYCWSCWRNIFMSDWGHVDRFHGWPGPMSVEFASHFFGLPPGLLERVEPQFKALPRATVPDEVMKGVGSIRLRWALKTKSGPESGTWPGQGGLKEGERLVMLDTETVFALAMYLGLDPKTQQVNSSWPLAAELMYCWRWYLNRDPEGFLERGREAAIKAGVDLNGPRKMGESWFSGLRRRVLGLGGGFVAWLGCRGLTKTDKRCNGGFSTRGLGGHGSLLLRGLRGG